ncbi:myoD family inhibitor [Rana temporaria]|uniref:myoD family inhibitor n=1 Tax=Rana temporaria TaxID=8407 RepID=UPI001AAC8887|nr:myoD family inhibitor [Rana temporaria]XP_040193601.1 myoD family inhibitor [Rana temporaria]XP_040193602.1 myoD family inhibitor [Rana temporaria]
MSLETYFPPEHTCTARMESESSCVEEEAVIKQDKIKASINGIPQMSENSEPLLNIGISPIVPPVTQAPKSSNSHPYSGDNVPKNNSQKKKSSQSHLEKQCSQTSKDGAEPPFLPPGAQEDCCVHCTLALLFCQFLSLCNILMDLLTCGSCSPDSAGICCSCCSIGGCPDCADSCSTDCGIVDACCESADCLEICMECCGLCFSS